MEPSSYWETENHLRGQENCLPVWNWNVHCRVHNSSPLGLFLSQTYPVRSLISYCFKICLITSTVIPFTPRYSVCIRPFISYLKSYTPSSFSSYRRIRLISRPWATFLNTLFLRFHWEIASHCPPKKMGDRPFSFVHVHLRILGVTSVLVLWVFSGSCCLRTEVPECDRLFHSSARTRHAGVTRGPICHAWVASAAGIRV